MKITSADEFEPIILRETLTFPGVLLYLLKFPVMGLPIPRMKEPAAPFSLNVVLASPMMGSYYLSFLGVKFLTAFFAAALGVIAHRAYSRSHDWSMLLMAGAFVALAVTIVVVIVGGIIGGISIQLWWLEALGLLLVLALLVGSIYVT